MSDELRLHDQADVSRKKRSWREAIGEPEFCVVAGDVLCLSRQERICQ